MSQTDTMPEAQERLGAVPPERRDAVTTDHTIQNPGQAPGRQGTVWPGGVPAPAVPVGMDPKDYSKRFAEHMVPENTAEVRAGEGAKQTEGLPRRMGVDRAGQSAETARGNEQNERGGVITGDKAQGDVKPGVGTQGNREAQKTDASKGADTLAPGVPKPQEGGPEKK